MHRRAQRPGPDLSNDLGQRVQRLDFGDFLINRALLAMTVDVSVRVANKKQQDPVFSDDDAATLAAQVFDSYRDISGHNLLLDLICVMM